MKKYISLFLVLIMSLSMLAGCGNTTKTEAINTFPIETVTPQPEKVSEIEGVKIELSDVEVLVDGIIATNDITQPVYIANDIIYYEEGHDFTYGEGEKEDEHSKEEADKHTVVHITQPGDYVLTGIMNAGQIAIDLGEDAKEDPSAIVNLYLNNVDIYNTVAPAIIFYNVYEPFNDVDETTAIKDVDTSNAGANVFIVDGTLNNVTGSYVARIYKPDSVVLSEDGKEVIEEKKLHKYDGAFYSKMTLNMDGTGENTGILNIMATNEGLDSEKHLTINGGIINIESGNDGINTNEDGISVTTMNDGFLNILVNGSTGEGDGIDSNGWLVINGGTLVSQACGFSMDGGIDSDMGIHINGGTVIASGNMLDRISESNQTYAVMNFNKFLGEGRYSLRTTDNIPVIEKELKNSFTSLIISTPELVEGNYSLFYNDMQLVGAVGENNGMFGGPNFEMSEMPEGMTPPDDFKGEMPHNFEPNQIPPDGFRGKKPEGFPENGEFVPSIEGDENIDLPVGGMPTNNSEVPVSPPDGGDVNRDRDRVGIVGGGTPPQFNKNMELSEIFVIKDGANYFHSIEFKE